MKIKFLFTKKLFFGFFISFIVSANPIPKNFEFFTEINSNVAPIITATGFNLLYCPLSNINIVTTISISDIDDANTDAIYIQISSGYIKGEDQLILNNAITHPKVKSSWNANEGKLTLNSPTGIPVTYTDFENAIKDVQFNSSSATPSGIRNFSISIGQANYLPRNDHYYEYVPDLGITWTNAKVAAGNKTYYGLTGYLATITADDEAQLAGKQASGAGWIGGSDAETEGIWKWVTGPEAGTIFWNGLANGTTPNFAFWNSNEPNQAGEEDYAHITAPGVGIPGSWNDLSDTGAKSGDFQPKGYIVEYGGTVGDPILHLSASTSLTIATISNTTNASRCGSGTITLKANATDGNINWYDSLIGGNKSGSGSTFTTPNLSMTTNYYVEATTTGCSSPRTLVEAKIINIPTIISTNTPATHCGSGEFTLKANSSEGIINWYSQENGSKVATGMSFVTPTLTLDTKYYAEAENNGCINSTKTPVDLVIYPLPRVDDEILTKCFSQTITLNAGAANMKYLWSTAAFTQTIDIIEKGIYTVDVTSLAPQNCTSKKTITVNENDKPEIKNIIVDETTVTIELIKEQNYFEFSIDGNNYQSSNVFNNAPSGLHTAYVREVNLCSTEEKTFVILLIPKFFTPNNDNYNDYWEVKGLINYPSAEITIFDRYGKLITQLSSSNYSWDGTFNNRDLPASDYWYVLKLDKNSPVMKGHFSLKR